MPGPLFDKAVHIWQAKIGPGGPLFTPDQLSRDRTAWNEAITSGVDRGRCFGCSSTPFMPEAIGLVYCTVHPVYILPEYSADSEHPVYQMCFWRA